MVVKPPKVSEKLFFFKLKKEESLNYPPPPPVLKYVEPNLSNFQQHILGKIWFGEREN